MTLSSITYNLPESRISTLPPLSHTNNASQSTMGKSSYPPQTISRQSSTHSLFSSAPSYPPPLKATTYDRGRGAGLSRRREAPKKLQETSSNSIFWTANTRGSNVKSPTPTLVVRSNSTTMRSFELGRPATTEDEFEDLDLAMVGREGWDSDENSVVPLSRKGRKEIERKGKEDRKREERVRKELQAMEPLRLAKEIEDDTFSLSTLKMQIDRIGARKNSDPSEAEENAAQLLKMRNDVTGLLNAPPQLKKKRSKFRLCGFFRSGHQSSSSESPGKPTVPLDIIARKDADAHHLPTSFRSQSSLDSSRTLFHSPSDLPLVPNQIYVSPIHPASNFIDLSDLAGIVNDLPLTKRPHQSKRGADHTWQKATRVDSWRKDCVIEEEVTAIGNEGGALGGLFVPHRGSVSREYRAKREAMVKLELGKGEEDVIRFTKEIAGRRATTATTPPPSLLQSFTSVRPITPPTVHTRGATPSPTPSTAAKRRNFPPPRLAPPATILPSLPLPPTAGEQRDTGPSPLLLSTSFSPTTEYRFPPPVPTRGGIIPLRYDSGVQRAPTRLVRHAITSSFESTQTVSPLDSPPFSRRRGNSSSTSGSDVPSPVTENEAEYDSIGFVQTYSPTRQAFVHPFPRPPTPKDQQSSRPSFPTSARSTASSNFNFSIKDEDLFFSQPQAIYERARKTAEDGAGARTTYQRGNRQLPSLVRTSSLRQNVDPAVGGRRVETRGMGEASAIRRAMVTARGGQK